MDKQKSRFKKDLNLVILSLLGFVLNPTNSIAARSCRLSFEQTQFEKALDGEKVSSYEILVELENLFNRPEYSRPAQIVELPAVPLEKDQLAVQYFSNNVENSAAQKILSGPRGKFYWFKHPFNTSTAVPYLRDNEVNGLKGYLSASRSIFFIEDGKYYSIRTPTDHPRGPFEAANQNKTAIASELKNAAKLMQSVNSLDEIFLAPEKFSIAKEIAIVTNVKAKEEKPWKFKSSGFMLRSLAFLEKPNHYYLPAFSIETVGKAIAKKHKIIFSDFWEKHYAEALARVEAQLLLSYGLQMDFPHGQNILLELDSNMLPTGNFVLRDIDDMSQNFVATTTLNKYLKDNRFPQAKLNRQDSKHSINLDYLWDQFSKRVVSKSEDPQVYNEKMNEKWLAAHTKAYIEEIARLLGVRVSEIGKTYQDVDVTLESEWGQNLLMAYFEKRRK